MTAAPSTGAILGVVVLIAIALALAIAAGPNLALAVPAGASAVVLAAALGLYSVLASRGEDRRRPVRVPDSRPSLRALRAFAGDRIHRAELVLLLDHVERAGPNPRLPSRPRGELAAIASMSPTGFRRYIATRVEQLERES